MHGGISKDACACTCRLRQSAILFHFALGAMRNAANYRSLLCRVRGQRSALHSSHRNLPTAQVVVSLTDAAKERGSSFQHV
jgi:hypothetical protein